MLYTTLLKAVVLPTEVGSFVELVAHQDYVVCERVQRGVRSRLYDRGRYSERREVGTHHFHELLAGFMKSEPGDSGSSRPAPRV